MTTSQTDVGRRIAAFRRLKRLTAAELASRIDGMTRVGLSKIETGQRTNVPPDLLTAIAIALDVSPLVLLYPLEDPEARIAVNGGSIRALDLAKLTYGTSPGSRDDRASATSAGIVDASRRFAAAELAASSMTDEQAIEQARENAESQHNYLKALRRDLWGREES